MASTVTDIKTVILSRGRGMGKEWGVDTRNTAGGDRHRVWVLHRHGVCVHRQSLRYRL